MKNLKFSLLAVAASMLLLLASCTVQPENLEDAPNPQANQVVATYTLHSLVPGTLQDMYQMDLVVFADGSAQANRSMIPFNSNLACDNVHIVGATNVSQTPNSVDADFAGDAWFIPFDNQVPPSMALTTGGGTIVIACSCSGSGGCNAGMTFGNPKSASCTPGSCDANCNMGSNSISNTGPDMVGVLVSAHAVSAN